MTRVPTMRDTAESMKLEPNSGRNQCPRRPSLNLFSKGNRARVQVARWLVLKFANSAHLRAYTFCIYVLHIHVTSIVENGDAVQVECEAVWAVQVRRHNRGTRQRVKTKEQYSGEFEKAGFLIFEVCTVVAKPNGECCVLVARKAKEC
jgi:hypothetical protein